MKFRASQRRLSKHQSPSRCWKSSRQQYYFIRPRIYHQSEVHGLLGAGLSWPSWRGNASELMKTWSGAQILKCSVYSRHSIAATPNMYIRQRVRSTLTDSCIGAYTTPPPSPEARHSNLVGPLSESCPSCPSIPIHIWPQK